MIKKLFSFLKSPFRNRQTAQKKEDKAVIDFQTARARNRAVKQMKKRNLDTLTEEHGIKHLESSKAFYKRRVEKSESERREAFEKLQKRRRQLREEKN